MCNARGARLQRPFKNLAMVNWRSQATRSRILDLNLRRKRKERRSLLRNGSKEHERAILIFIRSRTPERTVPFSQRPQLNLGFEMEISVFS